MRPWNRTALGVAFFVASFVAACEDAPPRGGSASGDAADDALDAATDRARDLAPHVVTLPPPRNIDIAYELVADGANAHVTWSKASDATATRVRLLRRAEMVPLGPFDSKAQLVYEGEGSEARQRVRELTALQTSLYAAFSCDDQGGCEEAGVQKPFSVTMGQALLDGGYTIYLRHGSATLCSDALALGPAATTSVPDWWKSCDAACGTATAAQLDASGTGQASIVGDALRTRGIPIGRVAAGEFCRTRATAQALGLTPPTVQVLPSLTYFVYDEAQRCSSVRDLVATAPVAGTNDVFVGHGDFAAPCDPFSGLGFADAALYRAAMATEPAAFIRTVGFSEWSALP